ncbi:MAG: FtsW/RodA/SpoVE family cell cycle protein [Bacteroides sp.]|nr:FtsW/RodA/SpoVE family cell cycle protein [Bacteroides sp.]
MNNAIPGLDIRETIDGVSQNKPSASGAATAAPVKKFRNDPWLWGTYLFLILISIVELFSASSTEVTASNVYSPLIRHGIFLGLGFLIVIGLQRTHYIWVGKTAWGFAIISLILLVASTLVGVEINGAQRALRFGGLTIQPAEMAKLAVVLLLAKILSRNQTPGGVTTKGILLSATVVGVFAVLLYKDGLTNTILMMGVSLCMFIIGGIPMRKFFMIIGVYAILGAGVLGLRHLGHSSADAEFDSISSETVTTASFAGGLNSRGETRDGRMKRWLKGVSPEDPIDDMNRQVIFSKFAQANGGLTGQGPGNSRESSRLPLAFSDYIFSIIIEDTGFIGGAALLVLFLSLVARAGRVAYRCSRAFPAFLIMGCAVMIVFQALVHMAIVTGLFPVSGQPLPFISKGGTSILIMSAAIGMMMSVSRYAVTSGNKKDIRKELKELPEDMQAANFSGYEQPQ